MFDSIVGKIIYGLMAIALLSVGYIAVTNDPVEPTTISINPPPPTWTPEPTATPSPIQVYVVGAVVNPASLHTLPYDSRVADAIAAAGGALPDANLDSINLAQFLQDGDMVYVPAQIAGATDEPPASAVITVTPTPPPLVNLNTATAEELETLPGIGPAKAADIIAYREANGPFTSIDELDNVSGFGPATLENLRPYITVGD